MMKGKQKMNRFEISIKHLLTPELLREIADAQREQPERTFWGLTQNISRSKWHSGHFNVVARAWDGGVAGYAGFMQSEAEADKWFYSDLWVKKDCRRQGIASAMVREGLEYLSDIGAKELYCTVEPRNHASNALQKRLGFARAAAMPFPELCPDGLRIYRLAVPQHWNIISLPQEDFYIMAVCELLTGGKNGETLHSKKLQPQERSAFFMEMKRALQSGGPDEANFILHKKIVPAAWLKINGLQGKECAWISMLAVFEKFQHQGIGSFAVRFAEDFARERGFSVMKIHTTADNAAARSCYEKLGYTVVGESDGICADGQTRRQLTFRKELSLAKRPAKMV